ncbi:hypothetical protein K450DRAFT_262044 [Umbelopsis ramanniana AG]|uniref:Pentatricopeptide repeat-containing protein n=1 Tax=Umbelopsis ramanniana AG TaxID=1314678 RepID=A0AAD5DZX0_UMBRA|nr:uncharacterized protein K450DRAFT_262044 [Umbelopsis ramanniana AG]KAI8575398.1 hypothetical protein K450DRAFT_262044 [Umbelopsis ramanniana AG]
MSKPIVSRISSRSLQYSGTLRWRSTRFISSSSRRLLPRFLTPREEQDLYQSITSSFREKLASNTAKSQDFYSSIIEQSLFAVPRSNPPSSSKVQDICSHIDAAVAAKKPQELKPLISELDRSNAPIKYYNYLMRAYIRLKDLKGAEYVLKNLPIGLLPSARTFTLLIQEYLSTDLDRAYEYMKQMQDMSCKLHKSFDYIVVMRLHIRRDDPLAVDFAWKDMLQHKETVKPTMQLYTTYLGYLGSKKKYEKASEVIQDLVAYSRTNDGLQKTLSALQCKTLISITNQLALHDQPQSASKLVKFLLSSTLTSTTSNTGLPEGLMPNAITLPSEVYTNIINGYMNLKKYSPVIDFYKEMTARNDVQLEEEALLTVEEARKCLMSRQSKQHQHHGKMYIANLAPV